MSDTTKLSYILNKRISYLFLESLIYNKSPKKPITSTINNELSHKITKYAFFIFNWSKLTRYNLLYLGKVFTKLI